MLRTNFEGDPNLGLYGFASDSYSVCGINSVTPGMEKELKTKNHFFTIFNTGLLGIFSVGNSKGIILPSLMEEDERENIKLDALYLHSRYTALGNLILMNDNGIILSPLLKNEKKKIGEFFRIPCEISKIAGSFITGKLGMATNRGCLLHPKVREAEQRMIEDILGVKSDIGTVNFGSPYPGSGIIANSLGCIVSEESSGPELGRITESLGFL